MYAQLGILIFMLVSLGTASAIPKVPHQFYGSVTINGKPAPDGTLITAKIDGNDVAGTLTSNGKYGYRPIFYIPDPFGNKEGKTIHFYVSGVKSASYTFHNGDSTELNLSVTLPVKNLPSATTSSQPSGSSPSPGGSIKSTPSYKNPKISEAECVENWTCTDWFECFNGKQTRICVDLNKCGTTKNKPEETKACEYVAPEKYCIENWTCTEWSQCKPDGTQQRVCKDVNKCGTNKYKPIETRACIYTPAGNPGSITGFFALYSKLHVLGMIALIAIACAVIFIYWFKK